MVPDWASAAMYLCIVFVTKGECRIHRDGPVMLLGPVYYKTMKDCDAKGGKEMMLAHWQRKLRAKRDAGTAFCKPIERTP